MKLRLSQRNQNKNQKLQQKLTRIVDLITQSNDGIERNSQAILEIGSIKFEEKDPGEENQMRNIL